MKSKNVIYPEGRKGLVNLIDEGIAISKTIRDRLNSNNCLRVGELFKINKRKHKIKARYNTVKYDYSDYKWVEEIPKPFVDQTGVYVFGDIEENEVSPLYVGITRRLYARLKDHGWGNESNTATFAHLIAKESFNEDERKILKSKNTENQIEKSALSLELEKRREENLEKIRNMRVAIQTIDDDRDFDLAFLEMVISCELNCQWNSFRTH